MRTARENIRPGGRGFTIVELLIVVAVIVILIGILLPSLGKIHNVARDAQTRSTLGAIQSGLQQYYADFNMYPPSGGAYGGITAKRGSAMLAQGLMGYLDASVDGAGPPDDPQYGFRTKKAGAGMSAMGRVAEVKGPYMTANAKTLKVNGKDQYFVDGWSETIRIGSQDVWNREILYFRSTRAVADAPTTIPTKIFGTGPLSPTNDYYFDTADCAAEMDTTKGDPIPSPLTATAGFFVQIGADNNTTPANVKGASNYLLISAGPDGKYFTNDDIIYSKQ
jgi:prepilin-type N-terminal cleavage/methylation domain-containing protein